MMKYIDLSKSKQRELPFFDENEAKLNSSADKGWSYSYVYHFTELKNVFIALKKISYKGKDDFTKKAIASGLPYEKTPWDSRRILEQLNALINFGLISKNYGVEENFFVEDNYTSYISETDYTIFSQIYHDYFRFKEIHSWLINPVQKDHASFLNKVTIDSLQKESSTIFSFMMANRFNDAFIFSLTDNTDIYKIPNTNGDLMRFWDVYVKWGQELKLLEKFNMNNFDYNLANNYKSFSCIYYINPCEIDLDLYTFIKSEYKGKHINIAKLVFKIALKYRYKIDDIKKLIIDTAIQNRENFSLQRTSEIFLRKRENYFLPKYNGSYISHILLQ